MTDNATQEAVLPTKKEVKEVKSEKSSKIYKQFLKTLSSSEREVAKKEPARIASTFKRYVENMDDMQLLDLVK